MEAHIGSDLPLILSCPHSGEKVPLEANWLNDIEDNAHLKRDLDLYVDRFYRPLARQKALPFIFSPWTRYAVDLNRLPGDVDSDSVLNSPNPPGTFTTGLHWVKTSQGEPLLKRPISEDLHKILIASYYEPFHRAIVANFEHLKLQGHKRVFHMDLHSMPSQGTSIHRDPGERRADIVISDQDGTSCDEKFKILVMEAYKAAGFEVKENWPYKGGRITETYGSPSRGRHTLQVEMNRALYMNEDTKEIDTLGFDECRSKIEKAFEMITEQLKSHVVLLN